MDNQHPSTPETRSAIQGSLRKVAAWVSIIVALTLLAIAESYMLYFSLSKETLQTIAKEHFPAIVGVPISMISCFFLVVLLGATAGPMEFKTPFGFEFKGAAGPVVLWVLCFLATVCSINVLW